MMVRVAGVEPALLSELDFEGSRVFLPLSHPPKLATDIAYTPVAQHLRGT